MGIVRVPGRSPWKAQPHADIRGAQPISKAYNSLEEERSELFDVHAIEELFRSATHDLIGLVGYHAGSAREVSTMPSCEIDHYWSPSARRC